MVLTSHPGTHIVCETRRVCSGDAPGVRVRNGNAASVSRRSPFHILNSPPSPREEMQPFLAPCKLTANGQQPTSSLPGGAVSKNSVMEGEPSGLRAGSSSTLAHEPSAQEPPTQEPPTLVGGCVPKMDAPESGGLNDDY